MNFLAHLFLSGDINQVMIGNFIGDYVKGRKHENYTPDVQKGILLHRKIDAYTDQHPIVKISSARFKPCYNRYASVVIDVVYDHFLAVNWNNYSDLPLTDYVDQVHSYLIRNYFSLPIRVKSFLPFLIKSRRLESYKHILGIEKSLMIMSKYTSLPDQSVCGMNIMQEYYQELNDEFLLYFDDVLNMVSNELSPK